MISEEDAIQYIEGPEKDILQLTENIEKESYIRNFQIVKQGSIDRRLYEGWSMKLMKSESNIENAFLDLTSKLENALQS